MYKVWGWGGLVFKKHDGGFCVVFSHFFFSWMFEARGKLQHVAI